MSINRIIIVGVVAGVTALSLGSNALAQQLGSKLS